MPLKEHGNCSCHPAWSPGALDKMIPKNVNTFGDITKGLESQREEPTAPIATVTVSTSHARKPDLVAFALAETIGFGEDARCHLVHDKICILRCKHLVTWLDQTNKRQRCCSLRDANSSRCTWLITGSKEYTFGGVYQTLFCHQKRERSLC